MRECRVEVREGSAGRDEVSGRSGGNTRPRTLTSEMAPNHRSRGWCWTINNPTFGDSLDLEALKNNCTYFVFGRERGEDRGTAHWQGYCYFKNHVGAARVRQLLRRAHVEPQRGTCNQAITYCKKDGDFEEWGQAPELGGGQTQ